MQKLIKVEKKLTFLTKMFTKKIGLTNMLSTFSIVAQPAVKKRSNNVNCNKRGSVVYTTLQRKCFTYDLPAFFYGTSLVLLSFSKITLHQCIPTRKKKMQCKNKKQLLITQR